MNHIIIIVLLILVLVGVYLNLFYVLKTNKKVENVPEALALINSAVSAGRGGFVGPGGV